MAVAKPLYSREQAESAYANLRIEQLEENRIIQLYMLIYRSIMYSQYRGVPNHEKMFSNLLRAMQFYDKTDPWLRESISRLKKHANTVMESDPTANPIPNFKDLILPEDEEWMQRGYYKIGSST